MSLLEIDSVNFSYGQHKIVSDVYLSIKTGEVVGFLGKNGCGKSTLLKIIFGSLRGENQSVRIDGMYFSRLFESKRVKFLTQEELMPGYLSVQKVIRLFEADSEQLTQHDEIKFNLKTPLKELSLGIRKYIETLIFLHSPCEFLLLDEPFSFVAPALVEKLIPEIKRVAISKGVLLTDHQYQSILNVSDRLYFMRDESLFLVQNEAQLKDLGYIN